jgi:hypothetical protein
VTFIIVIVKLFVINRLEPEAAAVLERSGDELELEWAPVQLDLASLPKHYLMLSKVGT